MSSSSQFNALFYKDRGNSKYKLTRYEEAILDYDKAIELDPSYAVAYYNRGISKKKLYNNIEDNNNSNLYVVNICDGINPQNSLYFVE